MRARGTVSRGQCRNHDIPTLRPGGQTQAMKVSGKPGGVSGVGSDTDKTQRPAPRQVRLGPYTSRRLLQHGRAASVGGDPHPSPAPHRAAPHQCSLMPPHTAVFLTVCHSAWHFLTGEVANVTPYPRPGAPQSSGTVPVGAVEPYAITQTQRITARPRRQSVMSLEQPSLAGRRPPPHLARLNKEGVRLANLWRRGASRMSYRYS
ncbi:hypothetical protein E2C01_011461 [Portunus trituberculatus]|uniref:Uncharacterized protein n=1 Tax=Portunus trituberculatus TaxID=210409 RepID=A0A5B7DB89_PORTR|nr:hypothetical protein [Portunus trituberculatus]